MCDILYCMFNLINFFIKGVLVLVFIIQSGYGLFNISRIIEILIMNGIDIKVD